MNSATIAPQQPATALGEPTGRYWPRQAGIRAWLLIVGGLILLPMVGLAIFLVFQIHQAGRLGTERELAQRTVATSHAVLERLDSGISYLHALALTDAALNNDFPGLHAQAKRVADNFPGATGIALVRKDFTLQFITARPYGAALKSPPDTTTSRQVFATGAPAVSGQFKGPFTGHTVVALGVPVFQNGDVAFCLVMVLTSESLTDLLLKQNLPSDWTASVLDRDGFIVARSRSAERFVGTESTPQLISLLKQRRTGFIDSVTKDGIPVLGFLEPVKPYRWHVVVGVPKSNLVDPLFRDLWLLAGVVLSIFLVGLAGASLAGKALELWITRLLATVRVIQIGGDAKVHRSGVLELDQMAMSLTEVHAAHSQVRQDLKTTEGQRDRASEALELALVDGLTGLRTRDALRQDAKALKDRLPDGSDWGVVFFDLDGFKLVNDSMGHEVGDRVLMAVGAVFQEMESRDCISGRWGGDEFVLVMAAPEGELEDRLSQLCERVQDLVTAIGIANHQPMLGCSAGLACDERHGRSLDELLALADKGMYLSKAVRNQKS